MLKKIRYNSPVILTFFIVSFVSLVLGALTGGWTTVTFFTVYRAPLTDPLTYLRMVLHVLGHSGWDHFIGNMLLLMVIGPAMEEKYGSKDLFWGIFITALISGLMQFILFPGTGLLGASGVVFMLIVLSSLSGLEEGTIPLTLVFVAVFHIGGEIVSALTVRDNISQMGHIVGGICGGAFGYYMAGVKKHRRKS